MKTQYLAFGQRADELIAQPLDKSRVLALAMGLAMGQHLPLPTSPVTSPESHYTVNCAAQAQRELSCMGENIIFNCQVALDFARSIWLMRYQVLHGCVNSLTPRQYGFFDTIAFVGMYFSEDEHKFVNQYKEAVLQLSALACEYLQEERSRSNG